MTIEEKKAIIEGLIFASADEGITVKQLQDITELPKKEIDSFIEEIMIDCKKDSRGIMINQFENHFYFTTKTIHSEYHERRLNLPKTNKLSQAALETLAIIAYRQPITRIEIEDIRGVKSERPIQTLIRRALIEVAGRKDAIGRPSLFRTTKDFLLSFGLTSLQELPNIQLDSETTLEETELFVKTMTTLNETSE
ncbi:MAG TPA: SMC-Scp complex subunit ScpB [Candidatus Avamphibacillus intestinigallinarum]|nr:SMC-Scp complex subunit ScpB [Candidatus Avamphibacillus intestinigallinarum]